MENFDSYFLMDTQVGKHTSYSTREDLQAAAAPLGIHLNLEPIDAVYSRYRYTWFDAATGVLLLVPPLAGFVFLVRKVIRLRRSHHVTPAPA